MKRAIGVAMVVAGGLLAADCATEGTGSVGVGYYDAWYDPWYVGGCCVDYPGDVGPPPRPEHPIVLPPDSTPRPEHPIAKPPSATPHQMSSPRPTSTPRMSGGGGGRGGGGRR